MEESARRDWIGVSLKASVLYCIVCAATVPFVAAVWIGELPVLALVQLPKLQAADWIRRELVLRVLIPLEVSGGAYSPNWTLARPYALAIVYLVPLGIAAIGWRRAQPPQAHRVWACLLLGVAVLDYALTLIFGQQRGLSIY